MIPALVRLEKALGDWETENQRHTEINNRILTTLALASCELEETKRPRIKADEYSDLIHLLEKLDYAIRTEAVRHNGELFRIVSERIKITEKLKGKVEG
jgi:hypothetical protein